MFETKAGGIKQIEKLRSAIAAALREVN